MSAIAVTAGRGSRIVRLGLALGLALALNLALLEGILLLNRIALPPSPDEVPQLRTQILDLPPVREVEPTETEPSQEDVEPLLTVDLDAPVPALEEFELPELEFDLDLSLAALSPSSVAVASRVAVHTREQAPTPEVPPVDEGPLDSSRVDQPPLELADSAKPDYPRAAQRRGIEGVVRIELLIDERGRVLEHRNSEGPAILVRAVVEVVPDLRFTPAQHRGQAVSVWGRKSFRFQLPERR